MLIKRGDPQPIIAIIAPSDGDDAKSKKALDEVKEDIKKENSKEKEMGK